jgi:hypothetical protein
VCAASDCTGFTHCFQKFLLIRARVLTRKFNLDVYGTTVRNPVAPDIGLAVLTDVYEGTVFRIKLTDRVVDCVAAVLTQSSDNLVL